MRSVDGWIPQGFSEVVEITMSIISKLGIIIIFSPPFLVPGVAVAALGLYLGNLYLKAQLSVKREMRYATAIMFTKYLSDPRKQCEIASVGSLQRGDIWNRQVDHCFHSLLFPKLTQHNSLRSGIRC
jgi:hypothetical protein